MESLVPSPLEELQRQQDGRSSSLVGDADNHGGDSDNGGGGGRNELDRLHNDSSDAGQDAIEAAAAEILRQLDQPRSDFDAARPASIAACPLRASSLDQGARMRKYAPNWEGLLQQELDLERTGTYGGMFRFDIPAHENLVGDQAALNRLAELTELTSIDINFSKLAGTIPSSFGRLTKLQRLRLQGNRKLTGTLPAELGRLTKLTMLNFWLSVALDKVIVDDGEQGKPQNPRAIASIVRNMTHLERLDFRGIASLSGTIPDDMLDGLRKLTHLDFGFSMVSGTVPDSFGKLIDLDLTRFDWNRMSGTLPAGAGKSLTKLRKFVTAGGATRIKLDCYTDPSGLEAFCDWHYRIDLWVGLVIFVLISMAIGRRLSWRVTTGRTIQEHSHVVRVPELRFIMTFPYDSRFEYSRMHFSKGRIGRGAFGNVYEA
eukprot:g5902.t1